MAVWLLRFSGNGCWRHLLRRLLSSSSSSKSFQRKALIEETIIMQPHAAELLVESGSQQTRADCSL
jgi:hypothetical protein